MKKGLLVLIYFFVSAFVFYGKQILAIG